MDGPVPISTSAAPAPVGPYGQGVRAGRLVFTVGVVGSEPATSELVTGGVAAEATQALRNLEAILRAAGSGLDRIVKATIFLADMADERTVADLWGAGVPPPHPALSIIGVAGMPLAARVEIECVALVGRSRAPG